MVSFLVDRSFRKIVDKKYNIEIKRFMGWSIVWRTSLILGVIGGTLSFLPYYNQLNWFIKGLLPNLFSIPIMGLIANYFLNKQLSQKEKTMKKEDDFQKAYDKQIQRLSLISFVFSVIWLAGIGSLIAIILGKKALRLSKKYETKVIGIWAAKFGYIAGWVGLGWWGLIFAVIIIARIIQ
jgi:membrane protein YqaA with SNARE-associated domain